ncbi:MAG: sorbitol dehydrogenase [Chloroflexota bacterium]
MTSTLTAASQLEGLAAVPETMRIGVMTGPHALELREIAVPTPGPGQVLVRLRATAICTWEQRTYTGAQENRFPFLGGHEMAGEVVALGPGVTIGLAVGDRVTLGPSSCGRCHWCLTGQDRACALHYSSAVQYGDVWGPGGFAEYKVQSADGCYPIGDADFDLGALTEPLACALHATRLLDVRVGEDAVVIGAGVMGLMNVVALKKRGARVIVSEIDPARLELARRMGADETINASASDPVEQVKALTEDRGAEIVIAAIGAGRANEQGLAMLAQRGRYVLFAAAHPEPPLTIRPNDFHNHERGVLGSVSKDKQDFYAAARLIRYGQVDLRPLIDAHYPLAELGQAMEAAVQPGTYRIVVTM